MVGLYTDFQPGITISITSAVFRPAMAWHPAASPVQTRSEARFPFKRNRLCCLRCVYENRKKRKRLRWQAANHGCHCFDRAFSIGWRLRLLRENFTYGGQSLNRAPIWNRLCLQLVFMSGV